ncbi:MAG: alkene reductase [Alphaproteobacteria bacterium]|nr:alkene reductase [Alphaproteobacteria bacterium]
MDLRLDIGKLFTPTQLGALKLKNRVAMAPLTRSRADQNGVPAEFATEYYANRAGAGLVITEATQVSFEGMGYPRTPGMHTETQMDAWAPIVERVHSHGAKFVVQLWHVGRIAADLNRGQSADVVAPSAVRAPGQMYTDAKGMIEHDMPRALETEEIARIAGEFAAAARNAMEIGFDGIELHSANGYLLHQFLSTNVNRRDDEYGGSIENRVRMPLEVLDAIVAEIGSDRVGIRVSPGHTFNGIEEADMEALYAHYLPELEKRQLAYLHVMRPFANDCDRDVAQMARQHYSGKIIVCGGYDAESGAEAIENGIADVVAFGKLFVSNPDLVERFRAGGPYNEPDQSTFYTPGREGYTTYPTLAG